MIARSVVIDCKYFQYVFRFGEGVDKDAFASGGLLPQALVNSFARVRLFIYREARTAEGCNEIKLKQVARKFQTI